MKINTQITIILPECGNFISDINEYKKLFAYVDNLGVSVSK